MKTEAVESENRSSQGGDASKDNSDPFGQDLIRSISAISGLAEESIQSEVSEMLSLSGQPAQAQNLSRLSLEELRAAMLVYLETINADIADMTETAHPEKSDAHPSASGER